MQRSQWELYTKVYISTWLKQFIYFYRPADKCASDVQLRYFINGFLCIWATNKIISLSDAFICNIVNFSRLNLINIFRFKNVCSDMSSVRGNHVPEQPMINLQNSHHPIKTCVQKTPLKQVCRYHMSPMSPGYYWNYYTTQSNNVNSFEDWAPIGVIYWNHMVEWFAKTSRAELWPAVSVGRHAQFWKIILDWQINGLVLYTETCYHLNQWCPSVLTHICFARLNRCN